MQLVRDFLDGLPEAMLPRPGEPLESAHHGEFLRSAEGFWGQHGEDILDAVAADAEDLRESGKAVADATIAAIDGMASTFIADFESTLDSRLPDGQPHTVKGTELGDAIEEWIKGREDAVRRFRDDPLAVPAWLSIGNDPSFGSGIQEQRHAPHEVWSDSSAPWREVHLGDAPRPGGVQAAGPVVVAQATRAVAGDDCWERALQRLPHRQINDYIRAQGNSPWTAAHVLEALLGPTWLRLAEANHPFGADAEAGQWFAQSLPQYRIWQDSASQGAMASQLLWLVGPASRERGHLRPYQAFHAFRVHGMALDLADAEPYAVMVGYCLDRLGDDSNDSCIREQNAPAGAALTSPSQTQAPASRWQAYRTEEPTVRGWPDLVNASGIHCTSTDAGAKQLRKLNNATNGPLRKVAGRWEANPGELRGWLADCSGRYEESLADQRRRAVATNEPGERGGARASDLSMQVVDRPSGGRTRLRREQQR